MNRKQQMEFDELREIVEDVFRVPLVTETRHRKYVTPRMVFARILVDRGHSKVSVGNYLERTHSTIIHYCRCFDAYYERDQELTTGYDDVVACVKGEYDPVRKFTPDQLVTRVFRLQDENKRLKSCISKLEKRGALTARFEELYSDIAMRTPLGKEEVVAKTIISALNGVLSE
jgi:hypothetical protein